MEALQFSESCERRKEAAQVALATSSFKKTEFTPRVRERGGGGRGTGRDSLWGLRMHFQEERPQAPGLWTGRGHSVPALLRHNFPLAQTQTRLWRQMRPKVTPARGHPCQRSPQGQTTSPITWFSLKSMSLGLTLVRREGLGS